MFRQYRGDAVGHKRTRKETSFLLEDRDKLDKIPFTLESERKEGSHRESEGVDTD